MKSTTCTIPSFVSCVVSRISECASYLRLDRTISSFGATHQKPLSSDPRSLAKQDAEEKWGQQSQSIDPLRPTKAVVSQSPINAYSSIFNARSLSTTYHASSADRIKHALQTARQTRWCRVHSLEVSFGLGLCQPSPELMIASASLGPQLPRL